MVWVPFVAPEPGGGKDAGPLGEGSPPGGGVRVFTVMQAAGPLRAGRPETACIGVGGMVKLGEAFQVRR